MAPSPDLDAALLSDPALHPIAEKVAAKRRLPKEDGADRYTMEQVYAEAAANPYVREFHIVGGLDVHAGLAYYSEMFRGLKKQFPHVHIKALTAVEIAHIT